MSLCLKTMGMLYNENGLREKGEKKNLLEIITHVECYYTYFYCFNEIDEHSRREN